jgi:hypothetical protein
MPLGTDIAQALHDLLKHHNDTTDHGSCGVSTNAVQALVEAEAATPAASEDALRERLQRAVDRVVGGGEIRLPAGRTGAFVDLVYNALAASPPLPEGLDVLWAAMENPTTAVVEDPGHFYCVPRQVVDELRSRLPDSREGPE